jgi:predicted SprT family Zn-dependent metalloprotease
MVATKERNQKEFIHSKEDSTTMEGFHKLFETLFNKTWVVRDREFNLPELGWTMGYHRKKRALGSCNHRRGVRHGKVMISQELLSRNLDKAYDFEDTIRHEIAHAIDVVIRGKTNHDWHWKFIARAVGADDRRIYDGVLEKPKGAYSAKCGMCGKIHYKYRKSSSRRVCKCIGGWDEKYVLDFKKTA